jgi:hypothetical protein
MKKILLVYLIIGTNTLGALTDTSQIEYLVSSWESELLSRVASYQSNYEYLVSELESVNNKLGNDDTSLKLYVRLLNRKIELLERIRQEEVDLGAEMTLLRYKKGLELIRLLYEKVLGLGHHFSSLQTHKKIISLSNPNAYPEFRNSRAVLEKQLKRDNTIQLPAILESNPYLSPAFSLITSVLAVGKKEDREGELSNISCILDFTARMNSELSTIYYETEYLKEGNGALKEECINLFKEYVKVVDYHKPLDICRKEDDWSKVYDSVDSYAGRMKQAIASAPHGLQAVKLQVELEFAVDRLLKFIDKYNVSVEQGGKYYQKFEIIISSYPNEESCKTQLPVEFESLKHDIRYSIDRFNEAYDIAALKGSKLKDLLYGYSE